MSNETGTPGNEKVKEMIDQLNATPWHIANKVTKVTYQKVFPIQQYVNEKIGIEMDVNDGNPDEAFEECKRLVEKWGLKHTDEYVVSDIQGFQPTPPFKNSMPVIIPTIDPRAYEKAEIGIDDAKTIQELEFYADIAVKYGLVEMYLAKKKTLE